MAAKATISAKVDARTIPPLEREARRKGMSLSAYIAGLLWQDAELIREIERKSKTGEPLNVGSTAS